MAWFVKNRQYQGVAHKQFRNGTLIWYGWRVLGGLWGSVTGNITTFQ